MTQLNPYQFAPLDIYQRGVKLAQSQRYQAALERFERAIEIEPKFPQAWYGKGDALLNLEQPEAAAKSFKQAIKLNTAKSLPDFLLDPTDDSLLTGALLTKKAKESLQKASGLKSSVGNSQISRRLLLLLPFLALSIILAWVLKTSGSQEKQATGNQRKRQEKRRPRSTTTSVKPASTEPASPSQNLPKASKTEDSSTPTVTTKPDSRTRKSPQSTPTDQTTETSAPAPKEAATQPDSPASQSVAKQKPPTVVNQNPQASSFLPQKAVPDPISPSAESIRESIKNLSVEKSRKQEKSRAQKSEVPKKSKVFKKSGISKRFQRTKETARQAATNQNIEIPSFLPQKAVSNPVSPSTDSIRESIKNLSVEKSRRQKSEVLKKSKVPKKSNALKRFQRTKETANQSGTNQTVQVRSFLPQKAVPDPD